MPKNIVIVGSKGRMGAYFLRRLQKLEAYEVHGIDVPLQCEHIQKACAKAHLVLLCVPAHAMAEVLQRITPHMAKTCILADITSVKVQALATMQKYWSGSVVGTHPLFGNKPQRGNDLPVTIVQDERAKEEATIFVEQLFQHMGCRTFRATAQDHDKAMAAIQNLNFITSLAYFAALAHDESLLPYLTPSFKRRQDAAHKLLTEDAELFAGLYEANPYSQQLVRKYSKFLQIAAGGDIDLLVNRASWWWE